MKNGFRKGLSTALLACLLSPLVGVAAWGQQAGEAQTEDQSMGELRAAVSKAEKKFLALYNKVNRDGKLSVVCRETATTGTKLSSRSCRSRAEEMAIAEQARGYLEAVDMNASLTSTADTNASAASAASSAAGGPTAAATATAAPASTGSAASTGPSGAEVSDSLRDSKSEFDRNLEELMAEHPDLRKLMEDYVQARKRLEARRAR